ncbi:MAG: HNH endonuclease [Oleispira sp.]|nr:HNH endonuclease [Oleispira sp.]
MITQEQLKELFHYCPESGLFTRLVTINGQAKSGDVAGCRMTIGYLSIGIGSKRYLAHRLAWLYMHGKSPSQDIDHINGDRSDNRLINLRSVSRSTNMMNSKIPKGSKSGVIGVTWNSRSKKWSSAIGVQGDHIWLGSFLYKWDAICVRKSAERKHGFHANHGRS